MLVLHRRLVGLHHQRWTAELSPDVDAQLLHHVLSHLQGYLRHVDVRPIQAIQAVQPEDAFLVLSYHSTLWRTPRIARLVEKVPEVRDDRAHLVYVGVQGVKLVPLAGRIEVQLLVAHVLEPRLRVQTTIQQCTATSRTSTTTRRSDPPPFPVGSRRPPYRTVPKGLARASAAPYESPPVPPY